MSVEVVVRPVSPMLLAAVTRRVPLGGVGTAWRPALDAVWAFLRATPGLHAGGHNVFLYHRPATRGEPVDVDFGVEVTRAFERTGDVHAVTTPVGEAAVAVHVGPYDRLHETHAAIHAWRAARWRRFAGKSWEIYGDWRDDPAQLETTVVYLLE